MRNQAFHMLRRRTDRMEALRHLKALGIDPAPYPVLVDALADEEANGRLVHLDELGPEGRVFIALAGAGKERAMAIVEAEDPEGAEGDGLRARQLRILTARQRAREALAEGVRSSPALRERWGAAFEELLEGFPPLGKARPEPEPDFVPIEAAQQGGVAVVHGEGEAGSTFLFGIRGADRWAFWSPASPPESMLFAIDPSALLVALREGDLEKAASVLAPIAGEDVARAALGGDPEATKRLAVALNAWTALEVLRRA